MKKIILTLLAIPLVLVACSKKGDDANLQGTWVGQVKTTDLELLKIAGEGAQANKELATESLFYKFEDGRLETHRSKDYEYLNNQIEKETGSYTARDGVISVHIEAHSCANVQGAPERKLKREVPYKISNDFKEVTLTLGPNKKIVFKKLESTDEDDAINSLNSADVGCFGVKEDSGKPINFKPHPVEKPIKEIDLKAKLNEIQDQTEAELSEDAPLEVTEEVAN